MIPTGKNIWFDMFRESIPKDQQTRKNWSIVKKKGMLGLPNLNPRLRTILRIYRDVQQITTLRDPQLRSTYRGWVVDVKLDDIEMEVSAGGTHHLRGLILTINGSAEMFLRRTVYTKNEVAIDYVHSHVTGTEIFESRGSKFSIFGVDLLSKGYACLGDYRDNLLALRSGIINEYSKIKLLTYFNMFYQFLGRENTDSPLNSVINLREKFTDRADYFISLEEIKQLVDHGTVMFDKINNPQNNVTFELRVDYDNIPEDFKEKYQAYYHDEKYYNNLTVPDTHLDPSEYEGFEIPYGDTTIPITIIDNDHKSEATKVFNASVFETNKQRLLQYAVDTAYQAQSPVDRSVHKAQADHQS